MQPVCTLTIEYTPTPCANKRLVMACGYYLHNKNKMTKLITAEMLAELFTIMPLPDGSERIVYNKKYINATPDTVEHDLYEIVSDYAQKSGLSLDFSYEIVNRACNALASLISDYSTIDDDSALVECVENIVPVYNYDLLKMASVGDYCLINDALEASGTTDIITACTSAWYTEIYNATSMLLHRVGEYNDDNQA